jgi:chorismate--pyruvate lyase
MFNQLVNIASSVQWHSTALSHRCTKQILAWLLDESSLTKKLQQQCDVFSVTIKQQSHTNTQSSPLSPYFPIPEQVFVREVLLCCDGIETVFAQTEIPYQTLSDTQSKLAEIGTESLGKFLFQEKTLQRGDIEIAEFPIGSAVHELCDTLKQHCDHSLWARRSLFYIENKPLLVSEIFLPASGIYSK